MPNWCYTQISVNCSSETKAQEIEKLFNEWLEKGKEDSDFKRNWIGSILKYSGLGQPDSEGCPRCRGSIADINVEDNILSFYTETAWAPMLQWLKFVTDKYDPNAEIIYTAEEPGCGIYYSNDPTVIGTVYIDNWTGEAINGVDVESAYDCSADYAKETVKKLLPDIDTNILSFDRINEILCDREMDVRFHEWEECAVEECA